MIIEQDYSFPDQFSIFFGHQSVGYNIVEGLQSILSMSNVSFPVSEYSGNINTIKNHGFFHSSLGENFAPFSKINAFKERIGSGITGNLNLAFFKFCYVDIKQQTDVLELFHYYKVTLKKLEQDNPATKFLHFTVPLRANQKGIKYIIKRALNFPVIGHLENIKRYEFNEMMREEFSISNTLFDIAHYESTSPSGKHRYYYYKSQKFEALQQEYTQDGGHLNSTGSAYIATRLLSFIKQQVNG